METNTLEDEWRLTEEDLEQIKDEKEKETGVFHWKKWDGTYQPVTSMTEEELKYAEDLCQKRIDKLFKRYEKAKEEKVEAIKGVSDAERQVEKVSSNIDYLKDQIASWSYREEQISIALFDLTEEGIDKELVE